ncbi:hypothetical protein [Gymnodinialimonas sp.]
MTQVEFAQLTELPLREAWKHEALEFTPWLAENIGYLSDVVGMHLELTGTEIAVDSFSADILARDAQDGTIVLIENQLETTDHTHLGQIMTYLAGLDAQSVIWIAPRFRDAHLSAIRWLNDNTDEGLSFFAVKAKVVRIGNSPFAPVFEVVEKPDLWERSFSGKKAAMSGASDALSLTRGEFWAFYAAEHPQAVDAGLKPTTGWNTYYPTLDGAVQVSLWIGEKNSGIYVRGGSGPKKYSARDLLNPIADVIAARLSVPWHGDNLMGHVLSEQQALGYKDRGNWPDMVRWMEARRLAYLDVIQSVYGASQ